MKKLKGIIDFLEVVFGASIFAWMFGYYIGLLAMKVVSIIIGLFSISIGIAIDSALNDIREGK